MRISLEMRRVETDKPEELGDAIAALGGRALSVDDERLLDNLSRSHARVQRGIRILKNDLHVASRESKFLPRVLEDVRSAEPHLSRGGFDEPEDAAAGGGFAAAGFPHEAERLTFFDGEGHVVNGAG
jgi:hypothetical protein